MFYGAPGGVKRCAVVIVTARRRRAKHQPRVKPCVEPEHSIRALHGRDTRTLPRCMSRPCRALALRNVRPQGSALGCCVLPLQGAPGTGSPLRASDPELRPDPLAIRRRQAQRLRQLLQVLLLGGVVDLDGQQGRGPGLALQPGRGFGNQLLQ